MKALKKAFWIWYIFAALAALSTQNGFRYLAPISISVIWLLIVKYRSQLNEFFGKWPIRPPFKVFILVFCFNAFVMENLAVSFKGDLHPNLFINTFLWFGGYAGLAFSWALAMRFLPLGMGQAFFIAGTKGILIEQDFLLFKLLSKGNLLPFLIGAPIIFVVYGAPVSAAFLCLFPKKSNADKTDRSKRHLGSLFTSCVVVLILNILFFYFGSGIWFKLFHKLLEK